MLYSSSTIRAMSPLTSFRFVRNGTELNTLSTGLLVGACIRRADDQIIVNIDLPSESRKRWYLVRALRFRHIVRLGLSRRLENIVP
jgi:hypothetical protein